MPEMKFIGGTLPDKALELVVGIDEVGRGPLAGPVVAAAVILKPEININGLADSKKLTAKRREVLSVLIKQEAIAVGIGQADIQEIDYLNILQASFLAMQRAVNSLGCVPDHAVVDGNKCPELPCSSEAIINGDSFVPAISAASIIAKVYRDDLMRAFDLEYPGYDLANNKGYPTAKHILALKTLGVSPIHRRSFKPVLACLYPEHV